MKKLLYLILLLPLWANAQTNGTIQKTSATGTVRGSFGSLGLDTLPRVTGALVDGYILKYHAATNKWYASPDPTLVGLQDSLTKKANRTFDNVASGAIANVKLANSTISGVSLGSNLNALTLGYGLTGTSYNGTSAVTAKADSTVLQTVANFFPKGDTRYLKTSTLTGTGIVEMAGTTPSYLSSTGTGNVVKATSPTLVTPNIGDATGTSLNLSDVLKFSASSATLAVGDMGYNSIYGQYLRGKTGSVDDWALFAAIGGYVMHNPTGTDGLAVGSLSGSGDVIAGANNTGLLGKITIGSGLSLSSGTLTATGGSSGSVTTAGGTAGMIAKFTSASNIENSIMTESGSDISVAGTVTATGFNGSGASLTNVVNSITGTSNQVIASGSTGAVTLSLPQSIATSSSPSFAELKLGTGTADSKFNTFTSGVYGVRFGFSGGTTNFIDGSATTFRSEAGATRLVIDGSATFSVPIAGTSATLSGNITAANLGTASTYTATASNTALTIPLRDSNGDFAAGIVTASLAGNASTATALQTARNIQGVSFNGTADINPINGTGFVKASGTTLSYDNSTYLTTSSASSTYAPLNSPALTGTPTAPTQTQGDNSTKIATTAYVDATATTGSGASKQSAVIFTDVNSSSGGAIDLAQHTISTATNGDKISFEYTGNFAANTNSKPQMILTVDGTDFTIPSITPGNNEDWIISGSIIRVSSTIYKISINYFQSGQNNYPQVTSGATLDTNSLVITLTAPTTIANNDIVLSTASIQKFNAP